MKSLKNNKTLPVAAATLMILLTAAVFSASAEETQSDSQNTSPSSSAYEQTQSKHQEMKAAHQALKSALEAEDYDAWVKAVSALPQAEERQDKINEDTFNQMVKAHQLMEEGDREGAKAIMEELGLNLFPHHGRFGKGMMDLAEQLTDDQRQQIQDVRESDLSKTEKMEKIRGLMESFGVEMPEPPFMANLTEAQKEELKTMHENGASPEEMKAWFEENNIQMPEPPEFNQLTDEQKAALKQAHENGDEEEVKALMEEYGVSAPRMERMEFRQDLKELTDEQKAALKEAHQSGDRETVDILMEEYGIQKPDRPRMGFMKKMNQVEKNADATQASAQQ